MEAIKEFYSNLKFPGPYTIEDLEFYDELVCNKYLDIFDKHVTGASTVLDVGCGSGFIVNFLARRHPNIQFHAIDFSDSIDYAIDFSNKHNIKNIKYFKEDFLEWQARMDYNVVLCQGVLHHIPKYKFAVEKLKSLVNNKLILGVYNPYGKLFKQFLKVKYANSVLYSDQEECPFELTFDHKDVIMMINNFTLTLVHPSYKNFGVDFNNLFNYKNGGLTVYVFKR
jgi:SAM-dependent methyltransferase